LPRPTLLNIISVNLTKGCNALVIISKGLAKYGASRSRKVTPIILGSISVPNRIINVKTAENIHIASLPYNSTKAAPATVAPPVWAIVFNISIAAIGRAMTFFILTQDSATFGLLRFILFMVRGLRLSNMDSTSEQRKETITAIATLIMNLVNIALPFITIIQKNGDYE
jgi:hypothetical protein